jgi:tetratricopeptide (TPR) repeat protein
MEDDESGSASGAWRAAMADARSPQQRSARPAGPDDRGGRAEGDGRTVRRPKPTPQRRRAVPLQPEDWVRIDEIEAEAEGAVRRGRRPATTSRRQPAPARSGRDRSGRDRSGREQAGRADAQHGDGIEASVRAELARAVGSGRADRYEQRLRDASRAFEAERFPDAARMLKRLADEAPTAAAVRELHGVTLYRLARWLPAAKELEAFRLLAGSTEQHPVLADCYRALGQHRRVEELWDELKEASPSAELVVEGRIVAAGSLADQGDVKGAVALLEQGFSFPKRPRTHHLRRAYALADCYERAGDVVRARELFGRVRAADPFFADARRRERALA